MLQQISHPAFDIAFQQGHFKERGLWSTSRSQPRAARAECPLDGHGQMHVRTCGHTDTDTQTLQYMRLPGCREQLHTAVGKTAPKAKGKIPKPPEPRWDHLPAHGQAGVCSLSVTSPLGALWRVEPQTRQHLHLPSTSLLPSQYPVSPNNYTSPFSTSSLSNPRLNNYSSQNENLL